MKKTIKLKFIGFPECHDPHKQDYYKFLSERYDIEELERPEYLIDYGGSFKNERYDCVKIELSGENGVPDFNVYDYAAASTPMTLGDRYVRIPWFVFYPYFLDLKNRKTTPDESFLKRKFCSFVVSNAEFGDPMRKLFFKELSKYKPVDSGGRYMNNVGGPVADKLAFCRGYKFNIAFENSSYPGYTTEKIMEAYLAQSVPIYYGNPTVETDFTPESMIRVRGKDDIERAIEEIIRLDKDDDAYMKKVTARCLVEDSPEVYEQRLEAFLSHIFDQPIDQAGRLALYGHQKVMRQHLRPIRLLDQRLRDSWLFGVAVSVASKIRSM